MENTDLEAKALEIHRNAVVVEGHSDIMLDLVKRQRRGEKNVIKNVHLPRMRKGGINFSALVAGGDNPNYVNGTEYPAQNFAALQNIDRLVTEAEESDGEFFIVREKADLDRRDGTGIIIMLEGAAPLCRSMHMLRTFYRLGLRILILAYSWCNDVIDGIAEERSSGLTNFGVEIVREMNRLGMLIDVSHVSDAGIYDVLNISEAPVIASHSNVRSLCNHPRNLSDEMIKGIACTGGLAGLNFFPHYVAKKDNVTVDDIIEHIDYIKKLVGIDYVALGPDFLDYRKEFFTERAHAFASAQLPGSEVPEDLESYFRFPIGVEDVTKLANITMAMLKRGYSEEEIEKVLGGNLLRVYKEVWK
jgi:membrane dipeptidase